MEDQAILDFGTSVGVNDELRRAIVSETEDVQKDIQKTKDAIASEQKIQRQLLKDQSHAAKETRDLHHMSKDVHERLTMMQTNLFPGMLHEMKRLELVGVNGVNDDDGGGDDTMRDASTTDENAPPPDEEQDPKVHPHSLIGIAQRDEAATEKLDDLKSYCDEAGEAAEAFKGRRQDVAAKTQNVVQKVQQLQLELSKVQATTRNYSKKLQSEEERRRSLEIKVSELKTSYEKVLAAAKEKKLSYDSGMKAFTERTEKIQAEVAALCEDECRCSTDLDAKKTDLKSIEAKKQQLDKEHKAYSSWKVCYQSLLTKRETERKQRQSVFSLKNELESQWMPRKARLERLQQEVARSNEKIEEEAPKIQEAEIRIQTICDETAQKNKEAEELEALLAELDEADPSIDLAQKEQARFEQLQVEMRVALKEEQDLDAALEKEDRLLTNAKQADDDRYEGLKTEKQELEKKILEFKKSWLIKRRFEIMDYGAGLIKKAAKKEKKFLGEST